MTTDRPEPVALDPDSASCDPERRRHAALRRLLDPGVAEHAPDALVAMIAAHLAGDDTAATARELADHVWGSGYFAGAYAVLSERRPVIQLNPAASAATVTEALRRAAQNGDLLGPQVTPRSGGYIQARGHRYPTDLRAHAGLGIICDVCQGPCTIDGPTPVDSFKVSRYGHDVPIPDGALGPLMNTAAAAAALGPLTDAADAAAALGIAPEQLARMRDHAATAPRDTDGRFIPTRDDDEGPQ